MMHVHIVEVDGRFDGVYLFAESDYAGAFADAVRKAGGQCTEREETVVDDANMLGNLIEQELADIEPTDAELVEFALMQGATREYVADADTDRLEADYGDDWRASRASEAGA